MTGALPPDSSGERLSGRAHDCAAVHLFIAFAIVAVYFLASRRVPLLTRHAVAPGMLYGIGVYFVMSYLVIPLPAALCVQTMTRADYA